ncbi:MAG: DUF502 domain-containing protein [Mariprofundaceae bacterium]
MLKYISKTFLTGLITILPVMLTLYFLYWLVITTESAMREMLELVLPGIHYWPGMGTIAGVLVVFLVGLLMHAYMVQRLFAWGEQILYHLPFIKSVYRAIRDFFDYFSPDKKKDFEQVVAVSLGDTGMEVVGFVSQAVPERLPEGFRVDDNILVYLPMSYMIGGYAVLMPRSAVRPLDMSIKEAMRFILTAGVTSTKR